MTKTDMAASRQRVTDEELGAIEARAKKADAAIIAVAADPHAFRMSIPPQADDTDRLIGQLAHEDVPALIAEVRSSRSALAALLEWRKADKCVRLVHGAEAIRRRIDTLRALRAAADALEPAPASPSGARPTGGENR
jgi:hypothetical protein